MIGNMKLLLVEDDLDLVHALSRVLSTQGFEVTCCADGEEALSMLRRARFDAVLLDLSLPGMDGLEVLEHLRGSGSAVPVLIMTARGAVEERVLGLNTGADDYLTKPFDVDELTARLKALVRRSLGIEEIRCGLLRVDRASGLVYRGPVPMELPARELALLKALMERNHQAVAREHLIDTVFGNEAVGPDAIDVLVHRLRKRLAGTGTSLITLRGVGYFLADEALGERP